MSTESQPNIQESNPKDFWAQYWTKRNTEQPTISQSDHKSNETINEEPDDEKHADEEYADEEHADEESANNLLPIIIGIVGQRGTGKSLATDYLCDRYLRISTLAFADPIREIGETFGFTNEEVYGDQAQKERKNAFWKVSFRDFATRVGTELFRDTLPVYLPTMSNCWVRLAEQKIRDMSYSPTDRSIVIISDVRFPDEAASIRCMGGYLIQIKRDTRFSADKHSKHTSETQQQKITADFRVNNNSTKEHLYRQLDACLEDICVSEGYELEKRCWNQAAQKRCEQLQTMMGFAIFVAMIAFIVHQLMNPDR